MPSPDEIREYYTLFERSLDGALTPEEGERFSSLLESHAELRDLHLDVVRLTAQLRDAPTLQTIALGDNEETRAILRAERAFEVVSNAHRLESRGWLDRLRKSRYTMLAVAASLGAICASVVPWRPAGWPVLRLGPVHESVGSVVVEATQPPDLQSYLFGEPAARRPFGGEGDLGSVVARQTPAGADEWRVLDAGAEVDAPVGQRRIEFAGGAEALVEGPARFVASAKDALKIESGVACLRLSNTDGPFRVTTPLGEALVTAPAVAFSRWEVTDGGVRLDVYEGEVSVQLKSASGEQMSSLEIPAGDSLAMRTEGAQLAVGRASYDLLPRAALVASRKPEVAPGTTVLKDSFEGDKLDPARWLLVTSGIPVQQGLGYPSATVLDGYVLLKNRAHLVTTREFDPVALGGIRIRGRWTTAGGEGSGPQIPDFLQVLTRSDGVPNAFDYGETASGLHGEAVFGATYPEPIRLKAKGPNVSLGAVSHNGLLRMRRPGTTFDFEFIDSGSRVTFRVTDLTDPSNTASASAEVLADSTKVKRVVIHNREFFDSDHVAKLHSLRIDAGIATN